MFSLRQTPDAKAAAVAHVQAQVVASIKSCDGQWCRLTGPNYDGWLEQTSLWGAYPGETVK